MKVGGRIGKIASAFAVILFLLPINISHSGKWNGINLQWHFLPY
jgi:hypothetical protein